MTTQLVPALNAFRLKPNRSKSLTHPRSRPLLYPVLRVSDG
ncbi:hypothetical protein [Scytonema sp. HK-05]|nr:hypothetical protein [Scytonema sp. HK-05]